MRFYKFALLKAYFDKGYSLLSYPKYILVLMGFGDVLSSGGESRRVIIIGLIFGLVCFLLGLFWFKAHVIDAEVEVQNRVNPFVGEVRNSKIFKEKAPLKK